MKKGDKLVCIKNFYNFLTIGKVYEVKSFFLDDIKIIGDTGTALYINFKNKCLDGLDGSVPFYPEYFIDFIEARRRKLEELSDVNFSNFLSKLKNESNMCK